MYSKAAVSQRSFHFHPGSADLRIKRTLETHVSLLDGICVDSLLGHCACLPFCLHFLTEPLRMGSVVFELTGSPADGIAAQAGRAQRGHCVSCYPGNTLSLFSWFWPWPCLEMASPPSSLWAARWICSRRYGIQEGYPFIAQTPGTSGFPGLFFSALCMHATGLLCTGACLITNTTERVTLATFCWKSQVEWGRGLRIQYELVRKAPNEDPSNPAFFHYSLVGLRTNLCPHKK